MIGLAFMVVIAWRMADYEDRSPLPWVLLTVLVTLSGMASRGLWGVVSPAVAIAAVVGGLWILRWRHETFLRNRPGPRVIR